MIRTRRDGTNDLSNSGNRGIAPLTTAAWLRFDAISRALRSCRPRRILEVGAGQGSMAWRLAQRFDYVGLEPDQDSFTLAFQRLADLGRGRLIPGTSRDIKDGDSFDLVCAFEVLEHLPDDTEELVRWRHLLNPSGHVLVSVPAHRHRFGPADTAVGHFRRYDRVDLERILASAGFEILSIEAWGAGLGHALEWLRNRISRPLNDSRTEGTARSGRWLQPRGRITGALTATLAAPFRLLQYPLRRSSVGIGWVALARQQK